MAKIKVKDGEDLSESNVQRVITYLNKDTPITKKAACEMLNITYNTSRLQRIIDEYKERIEYRIQRRKELRGIPLNDSEKREIIQSYLAGESLAAIEELTFRSNNIIKEVLKNYGVPLRDSSNSYKNPPLIPEEFISTDYNINDLVYAARYSAPAYVEGVRFNKDYGTILQLRILGANYCTAVQPYYEVSDLRRLQRELDVRIEEMSGDDIKYAINITLKNARKRAKNDK